MGTSRLELALNDELWQSHQLGDTYAMDWKGTWKIAYYPIFENGENREQYSEPRALIECPASFNGEPGTDFREVPLRYLKRNYAK